MVPAGKSAHQHQQRGLRQMKIRDQSAHCAKSIARRDENTGCAGVRFQPTALRAVLQRAHGCRSGGDDAPSILERMIHFGSGFRGHGIALRVELNVFQLDRPHRLKCSQPDMQSQITDANSPRANPIKNLLGKMQSCGGCGDRTRMVGKYRLIALAILRAVLPVDVWRQGNVAYLLKTGKKVVFWSKAQQTFAEVAATSHNGVERIFSIRRGEQNLLAQRQPACGTRQSPPFPLAQLFCQQHFNAP